MSYGQKVYSPWSSYSDQGFSNPAPTNRILPGTYRLAQVSFSELKEELKTSPEEGSTTQSGYGLIIELPMENGVNELFRVFSSSIMEPELQAKYPEFRTYSIQGITDPTASGRMDITHKGFNAMILSARGTHIIDPYQKGNTSIYLSYKKKDYPLIHDFKCHVEGYNQSGFSNFSSSQLSTFSNGATLRTYRFAVAATGEYTTFHGGTVAGALAEIVTLTNRLNTVYERDLAIRFVLVANNDSIIFTDGGTDPFTNDTACLLINESQSEIDSKIGNANYDVGHTVSTGGGGLASLGVICRTGRKARGITGLPNPIGDPFYIDFVAHEVGHQYGGNHTFNGSSRNCAGGNRNDSTAYEPGSGSTIQAYAGICSPQDIQQNSDDYFHTISLEQMVNHSTSGSGNNCPVMTATGNTPPVASHALSVGITIPMGTPFELTGTATDANGDTVTYCWEEFDLGAQGAPESPSGNAPIFRSWPPTTNPTRTFPCLSDLLSNTIVYGELLPTYTRSLNFRLTVRDNRAGGGGIHCISYGLDVDGGSGPFVVNTPTDTGVVWTEAGPDSVTWDVAGTTAAPVSCANVDILLSIDGGITYPYTLASGVANDGSENITVPASSVSTTCRVKVVCSSSVFFDISNNDFEIEAGIALPVELIDFMVSLNGQNDVLLYWQTASEINNDYFEVEWSTDVTGFESIARVNSKGRLGAAYTAMHNDPLSGFNYYRLVQYDLNGQFEIFPVQSVQVELSTKSESSIVIFPNPASERLYIQGLTQEYSYSIYDMKGDLIQSGLVDEYFSEIPLESIAEGAYIIFLSSATETIVKKLLKQSK